MACVLVLALEASLHKGNMHQSMFSSEKSIAEWVEPDVQFGSSAQSVDG